MILPILFSVLTSPAPAKPLVLAHYMPWYESKAISGKWGWHWTMNHFDPEKETNGRREIASKLYPLIGPYDSNDPDALDCQVQLMKLSGIDGAIIVWYGTEDVYDYATNGRNADRFIKHLTKAGLKFAICYEDQTLPNLIKFNKVKESDALAYGKDVMNTMAKKFFAAPNYVKLNSKPVLLVFGPQYYKAPQWKEMLAGHDINIFGVNGQYDFATGGFAWPYPKGGNERMPKFYDDAKAWQNFIGVTYPRFVDIYNEAKVSDSYGTLADDKGKTFDTTLDWAIKAKSPIIQLSTWNDWGEGTVIEPSVEYGYRDLEKVQRLQKSKYKPADLRLPVQLYKLRKQATQDQRRKLLKASDLLTAGHPKEAALLLKVK